MTWGSETRKVYNTVNKLFALSKYHPVGIMVYGGAELLGIPWETIIKVYREQAGVGAFARLEDYATDFLAFLGNNRMLFPPDAQRTFVGRVTQFYFQQIKNDVDERVRSRTADVGAVTADELNEYVDERVQENLIGWEALALLPNLGDEDIELAIREYAGVVDEAVAAVFEAMVPSPLSVQRLHRLSANLFVREKFVSGTSGVVIAGFGTADVTPELREFTVSSVVLNKLRQVPRRTANASTGASITPFAQSEMVATFIGGVNPSFRAVVAAFLERVLGQLPEQLIAGLAPNLAGLDEAAIGQIRANLQGACNTINEQLGILVSECTATQHVRPIVGAVAALPKEQLAEMAEALVNLTSFRQKVSGVTETVGGPIDVAIISKGDGFIWIKRKHYFKPELNQHFFANY